MPSHIHLWTMADNYSQGKILHTTTILKILNVTVGDEFSIKMFCVSLLTNDHGTCLTNIRKVTTMEMKNFHAVSIHLSTASLDMYQTKG